jgi:hypothetical protein
MSRNLAIGVGVLVVLLGGLTAGLVLAFTDSSNEAKSPSGLAVTLARAPVASSVNLQAGPLEMRSLGNRTSELPARGFQSGNVSVGLSAPPASAANAVTGLSAPSQSSAAGAQKVGPQVGPELPAR